VEALEPLGNERLPAALPRPLRRARREEARGRGPGRNLVHLPERRDHDRGHEGWADVWLRNCFGWEYKGKHKDLVAAYQQLQLYREDLENPPLLIVCDLDRFEIHTNFTGTAKQVHALKLDDLTDPKKLQLLRDAFKNPEALKPGKTQKQVTEEVAETFAKIADGSAHDPWQRYVQDIDAKTGIGTVRYPRVVAKHPDYARKLRERTLTNLYNERPAWLDNAHRKLDAAVFAAYGWDATMSDDEILEKLLALNLAF
jgi:hypothetical protein